ncbi:MAG: T9SS type A sorting domain-containing protein, partial [Ginsengibacter sp.]
SYTGSFTWGDDTPGFVFTDRLGPNNDKMIAECCTHESGHTVGLSHQASYDSTCTLLATYNAGIGSGQIGWAPIMGNSYYKNFSGWNNGPTPNGCSADKDNLSIITSVNGFTYRPDDHSDDPYVNPTEVSTNNTSFSDSGIITTNSDKDVFKFDLTKPGQFHIDANPFSVGPNNEGADLDIKLTLLDSSSDVLEVYDAVNILNAQIDTVLIPGVYFLVVEGTGNVNVSNYGSLGSYNVSGTFIPISVTPIKQVSLAGKSDKSKHTLSWNIVTDQPIKNIVLESSFNGSAFTTLATLTSSTKEFDYTPVAKENIYYRLKVTSSIGQIAYSNVISLKSNGAQKLFTVSTMVHNEVTINAAENYEYKLADITGRIIQSGTGKAGSNSININNYPNGIYLIQMISNNQRITERILKL